MQVLKEEIRERIKSAALTEFEMNGYLGTTMRGIASRAELTVGNLYRYFNNKDDLFETIMQPAFQKIYHFIGEFATVNDDILAKKNDDLHFIKMFEKSLISIYSSHSSELVVLLNGSKSSPMENAREEIIRLITERIKNEILPKMDVDSKPIDNSLAEIFSISFIDGVSLVLRKYKSKEKSKKLFVQFTRIYFKYFLNELN